MSTRYTNSFRWSVKTYGTLSRASVIFLFTICWSWKGRRRWDNDRSWIDCWVMNRTFLYGFHILICQWRSWWWRFMDSNASMAIETRCACFSWGRRSRRKRCRWWACFTYGMVIDIWCVTHSRMKWWRRRCSLEKDWGMRWLYKPNDE